MKKLVSILLALIMLIALAVPAMAANNITTFGTLTVAGEGTEKKPYKITGIDKLRALAYEVNEGHFDFEGKYFALYTSLTAPLETPIGTPDNPFRGNFNGCGNMVTLNINMPNDYVGMFGYCEGSRIENLDWQGSVIGYDYVGGICGFCNGGSIINCGDIMGISLKKNISGDESVGGICGYLYNGSITGCTNIADIFGNTDVGGICGYISYGSIISNCYNEGSVTAEIGIGGIAGAFELSTMTNCSNDGLITIKTGNGGGLCGMITSCEVMNCVNSGTLNSDADMYIGGLFGFATQIKVFENVISVGTYLGKGRQIANIIGYFNDTESSLIYKNVFYDNTVKDSFTVEWGPEFNASRTAEQMKSAEMLNILNGYVNDSPDLGLLSWETGASGYPCLAFSTNGAGSTISEGNIWIIAGIGVVAVAAIAVIVAKKKKKIAE